MGRKAKPISLHLLEGNKNRLTKKEIEQRKAIESQLKPESDKLAPPDWLNDFAKEEFSRLVEEMRALDLLTNIDVVALSAYCDAYSDYVECTEIIQEEGMMVEYTNKAAETNRVPHPLLTKKKQLFEQMKALSVEFGLTPSARAKIAMPKKEEKEPDEFEKMFGDV